MTFSEFCKNAKEEMKPLRQEREKARLNNRMIVPLAKRDGENLNEKEQAAFDRYDNAIRECNIKRYELIEQASELFSNEEVTIFLRGI